MEWLSDPKIWIGLVTLTVLEIVLGIDNVIFISILSGKLPPEQRPKARKLGLALALITRILLLLSLGWVMSLTGNLFRVGPEPAAVPAPAGGDHGGGHGAGRVLDPFGISGRDLILILGGLFLIFKSVREIHHKLEGEEGEASSKIVAPSFSGVIVQILLLDIVFSLDSVITAVGMVSDVKVMITAVIIATGFMVVFAGSISAFVEKHPTVKMLALSFLVLIGANLLAEGFDQHIEKGYTYFAMAFAVGVEMLNLKLRSGKHQPEPVHLRSPYNEEKSA
jgi:predicted tellurium resistance membrane protein TerC